MNYQETLDYLYAALPMFQRVGASAFKKDLQKTIKLCAHLGNPQHQFKSIHVAGTNGKGSTSHSLAAIFQQAGYKTGLYTSPHLKSFTERIRINGEEISPEAVIAFVEKNKSFIDELQPSFFEVTVGMAFWYFAVQEVDIAIIEVGMGGNFDSTNVIVPELSVITNIGLDHVQFLGDNLPQIAGEKAGIIKPKIPVVISQTQDETQVVFKDKAALLESEISFADQHWSIKRASDTGGKANYEVERDGHVQHIEFDLLGIYQKYNLAGILEAIAQMRKSGRDISNEAIHAGLANVGALTGLKGRWQTLGVNPIVICDTGHNEDGIQQILEQLQSYSYANLWMVLGMVEDKDVTKVLSMLPKDANYVFCQAQVPRAMGAELLAAKAGEVGLSSTIIPDINEALAFARKNSSKDDLIFVGGSTFVVAEIEEL